MEDRGQGRILLMCSDEASLMDKRILPLEWTIILQKTLLLRHPSSLEILYPLTTVHLTTKTLHTLVRDVFLTSNINSVELHPKLVFSAYFHHYNNRSIDLPDRIARQERDLGLGTILSGMDIQLVLHLNHLREDYRLWERRQWLGKECCPCPLHRFLKV